jgi:tRNA1Val (adenine37-N6)-methyltransferase
MGRNKWFEFKQFRIEQQKTAMKVGTDGVILGAWVSVDHALRILDVGTGTGLIALMIAQRCNAKIDAVEIDALSFSEAKINFEQSPWRERLEIFHCDYNSFSNEKEQLYDLIVCNPPFFIDSLRNSDPQLAKARHNESLTFSQLIQGSVKILKDTGRLTVILPSESFDEFRENARLQGFYLHQQTQIFTKPGRPASRVLLEFSLLPDYPQTGEIYIHNHDGQITEQYRELTGPYYLNI